MNMLLVLWEPDNPLLKIIVPFGIALFTIILLYLIRSIIHSRLHKWAKLKSNRWDKVIIRNTRVVSLIWCIWLGIYLAIQFINMPEQWLWVTQKATPAIFILLGTYTFIAAGLVFIDWYNIVIASRTQGRLDNIIMEGLKFGFPIYAGFFGLVSALNISGVNVTAILKWLEQHGPKLTTILVLGVAAILVATALIPHFVNVSVTRLRAEESENELKKRSDTLVSVLTTTTQIIIIFGIILMILNEVDIKITTLLAGLGVAGIAVGLGAQSLVKDIISGLFVIFEDQYRKGDVVRIADISGVVEAINLRRTILRDLDGIVHVVPNSEIRVASNFTKTWSRVNLNISVSYGTDLDYAITVINKVGKELAADPKWADALITPPQVLRVDNLGDSGIDIKILGETKPIRQWDVMGELRLRLKREFDKVNIEIPWPHMKVYFGEQPPELAMAKPKKPKKVLSNRKD